MVEKEIYDGSVKSENLAEIVLTFIDQAIKMALALED